MKEALREAARAFEEGEVPVGAVAVRDEKIIARAHNTVEQMGDATQHAELLALQLASGQSSSWRLSEVDLYVTLEPCPMCASAIVLSRVRSVYFAASDPRMGACGSLFDICQHPALPTKTKVFGGLLAEEAQDLLQEFFRQKRS